VGGGNAGQRNIVSGNLQAGISVDANSSNVGIDGNYIGLNGNGNAAIPNQTHGIQMSGTNHGIGGTAAEGNVIAGNRLNGISFEGVQLVDVRSNRIGTDASGNAGIPNQQAGVAFSSSHRINVGQADNDRGNAIAFNGADGVTISADSDRIGLFQNQIFSNGRLGIELASTAGVDTNDSGDSDGGANTGQNYPVINAASSNGTLSVGGTINTTPNTNGVRIEVFRSPSCDGSGNGEGAQFVGTTTVNTDGAGNANWSVAGLPAVPAGTVITSTATTPGGNNANTSEFSACRTVAAAGTGLIVVSPLNIVTTEAGGQANFTVVLSTVPTANVTIPLASSDLTEGTVSPANLVFTPANALIPQAVTVTGQDDNLADGNVNYAIVLGLAQSADAAYNGLNPADVSAVNQDNEIVVNPPVVPPSDEPNETEREKQDRETETEKRQREHTNRLGIDDDRTEGNVVAVDDAASPPTATIANRDGLQVVVLSCKDGCRRVRVGDYLEADGVKENEQLFYAEEVDVHRPR
jgi:hypothetical protein